MSDYTYLKLYRKIFDGPVGKNSELFHVWVWCLCKASYTERWVNVRTGRGETEVRLMPGQFIFGRKSAAKKLGMKESSIRNRIKKLEKLGNLATQADTHYSIITIINWHTYQVSEIKEDRQEDRQRTTKGQPKDTNNKDKKVEKDICGNGVTVPECPHQQIISLYHKILPELPSVKVWGDDRQGNLRARWREDPKRQELDYWKRLFGYVRESDFLMGKTPPREGHKSFTASLSWIVQPTKFANIIEKKYHD